MASCGIIQRELFRLPSVVNWCESMAIYGRKKTIGINRKWLTAFFSLNYSDGFRRSISLGFVRSIIFLCSFLSMPFCLNQSFITKPPTPLADS